MKKKLVLHILQNYLKTTIYLNSITLKKIDNHINSKPFKRSHVFKSWKLT